MVHDIASKTSENNLTYTKNQCIGIAIQLLITTIIRRAIPPSNSE